MMEHIGHLFSAAMPEIEAVKGRPLADLVFNEIGSGEGVSDDDFAEIFHKHLGELSDSAIEVNMDLNHVIPDGVSPKEHLVHSFEQFYAQYS